jgi:predicted GNAT family acetyltransferase
MIPDSEPLIVRHNAARRRYELQVGGELAVCDYDLDGDRMVFTHTLVPPALRGRGLAERLVRAGLATAQEEHRQVVPACSYVAAFIARHREYQPLLAQR